jgi:hypothetical protein
MLAVYRWFTAILATAVLVQIGAAGYGIFHAVKKADDNGSVTKKSLEDGFGFHAALGSIIIIAFILLLVATAAGRLGRQKLKWTGGLVLLGILQMILAWIGGSVPALGFLHPLNALVIVAVTGLMARRAWLEARAPEASPAAASPA